MIPEPRTDQEISAIYACPACGGLLHADNERLYCPRDGYENIPLNGIRDFLAADEYALHARFIEEYTAIRGAEKRGSDNPGYYLALPDTTAHDPLRKEWSMRRESLAWLGSRAHAGNAAAPLRVLDAGAGNCWLTRWLAAWGHEAIALDLNIDSYDGLAAGEHYLRMLPLKFGRVRADFSRMPFIDGAFDLVIFNASLHYAEHPRAVLAEACRVLGEGGRIIILDSPVYFSEESGLKMLAERGSNGRSRFFTIAGLEELARHLNSTLEIDRPQPSMHQCLRQRMLEYRKGREVAWMSRAVMEVKIQNSKIEEGISGSIRHPSF